MKSVAVFCGSRLGQNSAYRAAAQMVGELLAAQGVRLVYGGGSGGLMGVVADATLAAGGQVLGVIPAALVHLEHAHTGLTELVVVDTMHQRKAIMAAESDGFLSLAGGIGTLEELAEMWTLNMLGYQAKPMALLNTAGYYDHLTHYLADVVQAGFADASAIASLHIAAEPAAALAYLLAAAAQ